MYFSFLGKMSSSNKVIAFCFVALLSAMTLVEAGHHGNQGGGGMGEILVAGLIAKMLSEHHHHHKQHHSHPIFIPIPVHHGHSRR